jgi:hypothetical protein
MAAIDAKSVADIASERRAEIIGIDTPTTRVAILII